MFALMGILFAVGGCGPPEKGARPTASEVAAGMARTAEKIQNDPGKTPEEKEAALRVLRGMAAGVKTAPEPSRGGK
jgi:hypothetical protein